MQSSLLLIHALSPVHAGTGHSPGAIDLPIARDKATGLPVLPGSGIKGALRANLRERDEKRVVGVFGPETANASDHAGGLWIGDGNLLCLPVRSVVGTFAWVTSPFLLDRFVRDAKDAGLTPPPVRGANPAKEQAYTLSDTALTDGTKVYFEDLDFDAKASTELAGIAEWLADRFFSADDGWRVRFKQRFCVVHDDVMSYLSTHATDVTNRIRLENETKTVAKGALWSEESLPTETLLAALVVVAPNPKTRSEGELTAALKEYDGKTIRFGGDTTVGRGRCLLHVAGGSR